MENLKFKVSSQELREHLRKRAEHHHGRARDKQASLPELKRTLESVQGNRAMANMATALSKSHYHMDPVEPVKDLERDIEDHQAKAAAFEFFASHLFDEDYTLREDDLIRLEFIRRG